LLLAAGAGFAKLNNFDPGICRHLAIALMLDTAKLTWMANTVIVQFKNCNLLLVVKVFRF